jgi:hypothetical protein
MSRQCSTTSTTMSCSPRRRLRAWYPRAGEWCAARRRCAITGRPRWASNPICSIDVIGVYRGESTLVINYRNHRGQLVNEVLTFDGDGLVR